MRRAGTSPKAIIYYQQALEANPKDYNSMLMLAAETARTTREFDLDKEEKLTKAEKYAKDGMALIPGATKPNPQVTDAQWEAAKKDDTARGHEALGLIAMARKKYDDRRQRIQDGHGNRCRAPAGDVYPHGGRLYRRRQTGSGHPRAG